MKKTTSCCLLIGFIILISGCIPETQPAYYLSPLDINSNSYHTIPLRSDVAKSATYANFTFGGGGSNYRGTDPLYYFQGGIHRSQNFGSMFQAYYGAGLTLGNYRMSDYYRVNYSGGFSTPITADTLYHTMASNQYFGAYGFGGGLNIAIRSPGNLGEMRIGVETAFQNEFGNYLGARKLFADTAVDIVATYQWTKTIGGFMEFLSKGRRSGIVFGYRISAGGTFITADNYKGAKKINGPYYFSNSFHLTKGKVTGFLQFNIGNYTGTCQTGINYRLGKIKK